MKHGQSPLLRVLACSLLLGMVSAARATDPNAYEPLSDPGVGFNLISWWNFGGSGVSTWRNAVDDLHNAGFREVSISPVRYVTLGSGSIATSSQQGPELSHIAAAISRAKEHGMTVTVNPFVEPVNFSMWRGFYDPTPGSGEWNTFWSDYEDYLVDVAQVAQANGADALNVGTELRAITRNSGNNTQWDSVIAAVDAAFTGDLGYAANWDNYDHPNLDDAIWDNPAIDYLGIDAYFTNTVSNFAANNSGTDPNETFISQVENGWNNRLDNQILSYADSLQGGAGLPVVLSEVGYLPYNRTAVTPQNSSGSIDTDEQVMTFRGLLRALDGRLDDVHAMHIWQWGMPGSNGSLWNINDNAPLDQPNNLPLGQFLTSFVSNPVTPIPGDTDGDGDVDLIDLDTLGANFGATGATGGALIGDFDGDGDVDLLDLDTLGENFGTGSSIAIPEPNSQLLLALAFVALAALPSPARPFAS